ncbi:tetratricopeptide repeat protein [Actinomycetes bacterium KLBMP 9797]
MTVRIQVLGPVRAWRAGVEIDLGPAAQRAVLALLAVAGGQPLSRAELGDALWPGDRPASAANVIQTHVKRLRQLLEPDRPPRAASQILPRVGDGYALQMPADRLDLLRFRELVAAGNGAHRDGDHPRAAAVLGEALGLWARPMADVPLLDGHPKIAGLVGQRRTAALRYAESAIASRAAADALPHLEELASEDPLDEAVQAMLVRTLQAAGRRQQAFAVYRSVRRRLVDELGVDPGPTLAAAHAELLAEDARTATEPAVPVQATRVPAQLPPTVAHFIGRQAQLSELDDLLAHHHSAQAVVISAVAGTAGVGKTALAVHWAHRVADRFPDGQLYVNLRGYDPEHPMPAADALARFLAALGVPEREIPPELDERAARYRSELAGRRLLVLLDNASTVEQVRPLLPGRSSSAVLVTSRDSLGGLVAVDGAHRLHLDLLPPAEAYDLLRRLIGPRVDAEPAAAAMLADRCARLPLALRVAAELAAARGAASLADLAEELAERQRRLDVLDAGGDPRAAVATVFSWSLQQLPPDAARAFRLLGRHPGADADAYALAALADTDLARARAILGALARAHLVHATGAGRYGMHDLLRAYASQLAGDDAGAAGRLVDYYLGTAAVAMDRLYPAEAHRRPRVPQPRTPGPALPGADAARAWLDAERPTLVAIATHPATPPEHTVRLSTILFRYLDGGHYADALTVHGHAARVAERAGDRAGQGYALRGLGGAHMKMGRFRAATDHHERAVALFAAAGDPVGEAIALTGLGAVGQRTGSYGAAGDHHARAIALFQKAGDVAGEARALNNLAIIETLVGRHEAAVRHHEEAVALSQRAGDRSAEASALNNLGLVEQRLGRPHDAARHFAEALTLFRELGERSGQASVLDNLGFVSLRLDRPQEAARYFAQALTLFRELGEREGQAWVRNGLGEAALATGQPGEALDHHAAALAITADIGARDQQARAHAGLGRAHAAVGDLAEARRHYQEALTLYDDLESFEAAHVRAHLAALSSMIKASL